MQWNEKEVLKDRPDMCIFQKTVDEDTRRRSQKKSQYDTMDRKRIQDNR